MARPPVEWPIPVYVTELRERVVASFRLPARHLAGRVPGPLHPEVLSGQVLLSLAVSNGRCVKSMGSGRTLASELHLAELFTPVRWRPACRPAVRGHLLIRAWADHAGVRRLLRTALDFQARRGVTGISAGRHRSECALTAAKSGVLLARFHFPKLAPEVPWPVDSLCDSQEAADVLTVHPHCYFLPARGGRAVHAVPVHQYARSTTHLAAEGWEADGLAELLGLPAGVLELDHVVLQKRCTHTWSFPPERIPAALPAARGAGAPPERQRLAY